MGRNDPRPKRLTAETTHQNRPNRLTPKFGRNDPGRNDPAETTHGRNNPDSTVKEEMHLQEIFDLTLALGHGHTKHCPLHHVNYVPAKFEVVTNQTSSLLKIQLVQNNNFI